MQYQELSKRQKEILLLLTQGMSNKEIAQDLLISVKTVENHLKLLFDKLEVTNRTQAVIKFLGFNPRPGS